MKARIFFIEDSWQSLCWRRFDYDREREAIPHDIVGGGRLWETHGSPNGHMRDEESIMADPGTVITCYPKQVGGRYGVSTVLPDHTGEVYCAYASMGDDQVAVVVTDCKVSQEAAAKLVANHLDE